MHCDHMVQLSADLGLWLDSGDLTPKHVHLFSAVFFQFHLEERGYGCANYRRDISRMVEDRG